MAEMVGNYYRSRVREESYENATTKEYRYLPVKEAIEVTPRESYDYEMMENVEVCIKFDDMAEYLIERGFDREITKREALELIKKSEEDGLVHFVDNAQGDVKHNCNCCGCCCWNLEPIRRREMQWLR